QTRVKIRYGTSFNDNKTHSITAGWQHSITERLTGGLALTYANYKSSGNQRSEYDTYNFAVTSSYLLSEKWSLSGQVGYRTLENEITPIVGPTLTDESSGSLFSFSSVYEGESNNVTFTLGRSLNPSGEGVVNEQDRISLNWRRDLSDTMSLTINTSYQENTNSGQY
ncbi:autotransporter domain-containing protein, partial [Methylophaga muralis]|uniref:autotransporter domain-containing protein n=1 Tax=Methylophaga muralis TaxID=291169 RepID=UPI00159F1FB2